MQEQIMSGVYFGNQQAFSEIIERWQSKVAHGENTALQCISLNTDLPLRASCNSLRL